MLTSLPTSPCRCGANPPRRAPQCGLSDGQSHHADLEQAQVAGHCHRYGQDMGNGAAPCQGLCTDPSPLADPNSVTYVVQMQVLGTMQWVVLVTGVQDTTYTVHRLTKGAQYLFRVITATPKTNSKPSPPVGPVQLLDRGERGSGEGRGSWRRGLCPLLGGELPRAGWQGAGKGW